MLRILILILVVKLSFAQFLGYEWIEPNRNYKKIIITEDGICRVYASQLQLPNVNPNNIYLYFRGQEVPFYLYNTGDPNLWDSGDYIEFFAQKNDGKIEAKMYKNPYTFLPDPNQQPDSLYSVYTDTSAYFLTWKETPSTKATIYNNNNYTGASLNYIDYLLRTPYNSYWFVGAGHGITTGLGFYKNPDWTTAEGFTSSYITTSYSENFTLPKFLNSGKNIKVQYRLAGVSYKNAEFSQHNATIDINGNINNINHQGIFIQTYEQIILPQSSVNFNLTVNEGSFLLTFIHILYSRSTDLTGEKKLKFYLTNTLNQEFWIEFTNVPFANSFDNLLIWDLTTKQKLVATRNGNNVKIKFPKFSGTHEFFLQVESSLGKPMIMDASIRNLSSPTNGYEFIIITDRSLSQSAEAYKTYRDTNSLNNLSTIVVYNDEIYDEFGYGSMSALAIKNFLKTANLRWQTKPKFVLLWGKGGTTPRHDNYTKVLTWGYPASDWEFVSYWNDTTKNFSPNLAIGRVNIENEDEGFAYLNKVIAYEHIGFGEWNKTGVHLGGGANAYEQKQISYYLTLCKGIFEGPPFLGSVFYKQKNTSNIGQSFVDTIKNVVNNGVLIINFFGHSSTNIYDVDIGQPTDYDKLYGKYPIILGNGCYGGDFLIPWKSFAEQWINGYPERGAIAYVGTSTTGYVYYLGQWMQYIYKQMFQQNLGDHFGNYIKNAITQWYNDQQQAINYFTSYHFIMMHCLTNNIQGDPSILSKIPTKPDLTWDATSFDLGPKPVSAQWDSITIPIKAKNLGSVLLDSFSVNITQTVVSKGIFKDFGHFKFAPFYKKDTTLAFKIPALGNQMAGVNKFRLFIDSEFNVVEQNENNNIFETEIYIPSNLPITIYPYPYAIVNNNQISLKAGTYDPQITEPVDYVFEIDTAYNFSSPFKKSSGIITGNTLLAEWKLPFTLENNQVYYWRVRLANETRWASASFKYIQGPEVGFAQAEEPQFLECKNTNVSFSAPNFQWKFLAEKHFLKVTNSGNFARISYDNVFLDEYFTIPWQKGILYTIIDGNTLKPITHHPVYGEVDFLRDVLGYDKLTTVIQNMKNGDYIIIAAVRYPDLTKFSQALWQELSRIGVSNQLRQQNAIQAFTIIGRKGSSPGTAIEKLFAPWDVETQLFARYDEAFVESPILGPATQWKNLIWDWFSTDNSPVNDTITLKLIGIDKSGTETELTQIPTKGTFNIANINASQYPYLKIKARLTDKYYRTAPQIRHWHLYYVPTPEAMINPYEHWVFKQDTVTEGDSIYLECFATNISAFNMDSLLVKYEVITPDNQRKLIGQKRYGKLPANQSILFSYNFSSYGFPGENTLVITINPDFDQPEQSLHNNVYSYKFYVIEDKINPILDVTVDGKHVLDGDIISPKPEIVIEVNDENKYLLIDDTSAVSVYFKNAYDLSPAPRISYASGKLKFEPATTPENKARVYFYPGPLEDGDYLLEVQSKDKKGNPSGKQRYSVRLKVINESTITDVVNYPNPFSTSTRFVYTLTGAELPEVFKIYIYTVSGRLVKVIDLLELGEVRIGQNITNYAWDGKDDYGDLLANGVYLYKVELKMPDGSTIKKNNKETSKYFKNGFGKMYIMR